MFQSTRLREARPRVMFMFGVLKKFQSTRLREARPSGVCWYWALNMFQSTRLREARLVVQPHLLNSISVSIHAPAGGATLKANVLLVVDLVSIHAPAGGATM